MVLTLTQGSKFTRLGVLSKKDQVEALSAKFQAHRLAVTSLEWLTPFTLISASLDGHITTYLLKSASLEQQRSLMIRVNDLPRKIRKSNSTSKPTGITSLCVTNEKIFVGGETGAIWSVTLPELSVAVIGYDIDGIETLLYHSPYLLLISPSAKAKLLTQEGTLVHVFECDVRTARRDPIGLLLCGNNEQIFCWDVRDRCHSMQHKMPHITFAVSHERELTTVDENFAVSVYQIEYES
ncbi:hypothetical protein Tcan_17694 [Toxocara canis]|uniref:Uncharacterized protein n=1 Tax=Toxocara canis TaxID=6265 RepID=A0A0B2UWX8_TOXCA|nr:hypothetical protein Tcan_17694 [Toxocara canis]